MRIAACREGNYFHLSPCAGPGKNPAHAAISRSGGVGIGKVPLVPPRGFSHSPISSEGPGYCSMLKSRALLRETGQGYVPQCESDSGTFSPMQCDEAQESCWCVFANGEEAPGTRVRGKRPACQRESPLQPEQFCISVIPSRKAASRPQMMVLKSTSLGLSTQK